MIAAIDTTETVCVAQEVHSMSATASAALGRTLTAASIMGSMLKSDNGSVTVKLSGGGPLGVVTAIADNNGNTKGNVQYPGVELPIREDGKLDVGRAIGSHGKLCVIRDFGSGEPYIGHVELVSGEVAEDITSYYATSEQIPTVCALGVLTNKESRQVMLSGGLLVQVLPGAYESDIAKLEDDLKDLQPITTMMAKGLSLEQICDIVLKSFKVDKLDETPIHYACNCGKEKYAAALITLGEEELKSLPTQEGKVETVCPYCSKKYYFSKEEIEELISYAKAK